MKTKEENESLASWVLGLFLGIISSLLIIVFHNYRKNSQQLRVKENDTKLEYKQFLVDYWAKIKDVIANQDNIIVKYELEGAGILIGLLTASGIVYKDEPKIAGILAFLVAIISLIFMRASFFYYGLLGRAAETAIEIEKELFGEADLERKGLTYNLDKFSQHKTFLGMSLGSLITYTTLGGIFLLAMGLGIYYFGWWPPIIDFFRNVITILGTLIK